MASSTKESGRLTNNMEWAFIDLSAEHDIAGNGNMAKWMGMEFMRTWRDKSLLVSMKGR